MSIVPKDQMTEANLGTRQQCFRPLRGPRIRDTETAERTAPSVPKALRGRECGEANQATAGRVEPVTGVAESQFVHENQGGRHTRKKVSK
jgi:hypothetical protein